LLNIDLTQGEIIMKKNDKALMFFLLIISFFMFFILNRIALIYERTNGDILSRVKITIENILTDIADKPLMIGTSKTCIIAGLIGTALLWLIYFYNVAGRKKYMHGIEHGSAEWGSPSDISNFIDKEFRNNILLTKTERLSMSDRMKRTKYDDYNRNKHVLVIGGTGSGKTRNYAMVNLMQMHSNYVIVDPKGKIVHETGKMLTENGYMIKVLDLVEREQSDKYNPFKYMRTADDILKLINNIIANTNTPQSKSAGDFWEKAETALLEAIFGYVLFETQEHERTIATAMELLRLAEVKEDNEDYKSALDIIFDELRTINPNHFAVKQYDIYKFAAGRTAKSILVSLGVRMAPFNIDSISNIVSGDTLGLDMIGTEKTALFVILPDTDKSFNFLAAMMFQQMFDVLVYKADREYFGKLPHHVRCIIDEFANIGQIPMLEVLISTIRSRGISLNIILQNLAQIKSLYKDTWEIITGNCESLLYLGGMEHSTHEYISKLCGKTTIDNKNISESKGQVGSYSLNYQILGRDLITPDEVGRLKRMECILIINGCKPFRSRKYELTEHVNYKYLAEFNMENWFRTEDRELCHRRE